MMKRHRMVLAAAIAVLAGPLSLVTSASAHTMGNGSTMNDTRGGPGPVVELIRAAVATAPFLRFENAARGGYSIQVADINGITCIADPTVPSAGAMGVHYLSALDNMVEASKPQVLVYEPDGAGHNRLVALEYIVDEATWLQTHSGPPKLFGQEFMFTPAGNRFGLPAYYSLHAWIWKFNPSGTFAMWNPNVLCP